VGHATAAERAVGDAARPLAHIAGLRSGRAEQPRLGARANSEARLRPDKPLALTVSTRNLAPYRDPAVILIDQLKEIYVDGVLDPLDTTQWYPKLMRKDYAVGLNITETAVDDPDPAFYENYVCGAMRNYTGYCNAEVDKMVDAQSEESDVEKRRHMVWAIEKKLASDDARPILFYNRVANCWHPQVKGLTLMVNSIYNGNRFEDLWLDK
jgi:peptide/nickel transport system substrate-binding protein